jgi:hydrogenase maturation protease
MKMSNAIRIIGVGNPLMGDDGIGIAAVERLEDMTLPDGVEVIDGGTGGLTLLQLMDGARAVLLIDAVEMDRPPGSVARFTLDDILPAAAEPVRLSLHETGLPEVFALGREMAMLPPLVLFGVQPAVVERRLGLSPSAESALDEVVHLVFAELRSLRGAANH